MMRKSILITGAGGMIGTALTQLLMDEGHDLTLVDVNQLPELTAQRAIDYGADIHSINVADRAQLNGIARKYNAVYHLAAHTENRPDKTDPMNDLQVTVGGTVALLDALSDQCPDCFILTSSQLVYGNEVNSLASEEAPVRAESYFTAAKISAEAFLQAYSLRNAFRGVVARLANIIGPGFTRGVIHDFASGAIKGSIEVLGNGTQRRSFVHSHDCARALIAAANNAENPFEIFNISNVDSISIRKVADIVAEASGSDDLCINLQDEESGWDGDVPKIHPSPQKLLNLGWQPMFTSEQAVRSAACWQFDFQRGLLRWK